MIGTSLSHYRITAKLGQGGMGEVYRATDDNLGRDVAIKVLPEEVAKDSERLARFRREAHLLASLNHTNIAAIHGLEEADGKPFLVLELVDGEDLSERLKRGAIPVDEAIEIAKQIAEALEEAHERGIVHRDLKPANIKITSDDRVKVLDFGLAKAYAGDSAEGSAPEVSQSPTMSAQATQAGVILGTAAYMSPEQARGKPVDKRADIWAFGVVLYEMLAGKQLFAGETVSDTLAAVLTREPEWGLLPPSLARPVREVLRRCLERNPKQRLHDIADARLVLDDVASGVADAEIGPAAARAVGSARLGRSGWVLVALALLASGWLAGRGMKTGPTAESGPSRLSVLPPPGGFLHVADPAVSPDGRTIAFVAPGGSSGDAQVWLRDLDSLAPRPIPESDGASQPFWSPDGDWVGFFARNKLKKAPRAGGSPQILADVPNPRGGTWNARGEILFTPVSFRPVLRTTAGGDPTRPVTAGDMADAERLAERHSYPHFLPDGRHFLFSRGPGIVVGDLDSSEVKDVAPIASRAQYAMGHLFFVKDGDLYAQPFDLERLALSGEASRVAERIGWFGRTPDGFAFSASEAGTLAYWEYSANPTMQLTWFDRAGNKLGVLGEPGEFNAVALSPDGRQVAVELHEPGSGHPAVWLIDVSTGARSRFASYDKWTAVPIWSADSRRLLLTDFTDALHILPLDGGPPQEVPIGARGGWPSDWSKDGRTIVFTDTGSSETKDILVIPTDGGAAISFLGTPFDEHSGKISPDGSWLAYVSDESGRAETYVQSFPKAGAKTRISTSGGFSPAWRRDGRAIFYVARTGEVMEAELAATSSVMEVRRSLARFVGRVPFGTGWHDRSQIGIAADGERFLMALPVSDEAPRAITVILNWQPGAK